MSIRMIARRGGLIAAAPLAGLLAMAALDMRDDLDAAHSVRAAMATAAVLPQISAFLHAVQLERAEAIAVESAPLTPPRAARRAQTDAAARTMIAAIRGHAPGRQDRAAATPDASLCIAESAPDDLAALRAMVDARARPEDVTHAYSITTDRVLSGMMRLRKDAPNQAVANDVLSLILQLRISELAALERAAGAAALARGGFAPDAFIAFANLSARQDAMLDGLKMPVAPDIAVAIDKALTSAQARDFDTRRAALADGRGAIPQGFADARAWQTLADARINALTLAQSRTISWLSGALAQARAAAEARVRAGAAKLAVIAGLLAAAGLAVGGPARRAPGGRGPGAPATDRRAPAGSSAMMIVDFNGLVAFISPGLDAALLRSARYFSARRPHADFATIKGQNVDLFDMAAPGGFRAMLRNKIDGPAGELRFDGRRFAINSSRIRGRDGKPGHVVEWVERPPRARPAPGMGRLARGPA